MGFLIKNFFYSLITAIRVYFMLYAEAVVVILVILALSFFIGEVYEFFTKE